MTTRRVATVYLDGERVRDVIGWDEAEGWVDVVLPESDGRALKRERRHGVVRIEWREE